MFSVSPPWTLLDSNSNLAESWIGPPLVSEQLTVALQPDSADELQTLAPVALVIMPIMISEKLSFGATVVVRSAKLGQFRLDPPIWRTDRTVYEPAATEQDPPTVVPVPSATIVMGAPLPQPGATIHRPRTAAARARTPLG